MRLVTLALVVLLSGCGTFAYTPGEYEITSDRIDSFKLSGEVQVVNLQNDDSARLAVSAPARDWVTSYRAVTAQMAEQLKKEIGKHGLLSPGSPKVIGLKVTDQRGYQHFQHMTGTFSVEVTLGAAPPFTISLENGSPAGIFRLLNGNVALGIIEILHDQRVLDYLSS